jgi:zinc D-Ala-D-Ala carboxypeptidase
MSNFSVQELTRTDTDLDNIPTPKIIVKLKRLIATLELVRSACIHRPVVISSGYRSPEVNAKIKGSPTSAHMRGDAADFNVTGLTNAEVCKIIRNSNIEYDQLIEENKGGTSWVHIGLSDTPRQQYMIMRNGIRAAK